MIGLGTIINGVSIVAAGLVGQFAGKWFKPEQQESLNRACGVSILFIIIRPWGRGNLAAAITAKIIMHGSKKPTRRQRKTWRGLAWRLKSRWKHPHWNPVRTE